MNKKAVVIGKAILSVVTIIVIVFIMGTFLIIASGISTLKKPELEKAKLFSSDSNNGLFRFVTVELNSGVKTEILLYDAISLWLDGSITKSNLAKSIEPLLDEENNCAAITRLDTLENTILKLKDGKVSPVPYNLELFVKDNSIYKMYKGSEQIKIIYYLGPCP